MAEELETSTRTFDVSEVDRRVPGLCHFTHSVISVQITAGSVSRCHSKVCGKCLGWVGKLRMTLELQSDFRQETDACYGL